MENLIKREGEKRELGNMMESGKIESSEKCYRGVNETSRKDQGIFFDLELMGPLSTLLKKYARKGTRLWLYPILQLYQYHATTFFRNGRNSHTHTHLD